MLCSENHSDFVRMNPSFPVSTKPGAYQTLEEITQLVRATLEYLGEDADKILSTLKVSLTRATEKHGSFRATPPDRAAQAPLIRSLGLVPTRDSRLRKLQNEKLIRALYAENAYKLALAFSRDSMMNMPLHDRIGTVVHEVCHLVNFMRQGGVTEAGGHGEDWKALMRACGEEPKVTKAGTETMNGQATCGCPDVVNRVDIKIAADLFTGTASYLCRKCDKKLAFKAPPETVDARRRFDRLVVTLREKSDQRARERADREQAVRAQEIAASPLGKNPPHIRYADFFGKIEDAFHEKNYPEVLRLVKMTLGFLSTDELKTAFAKHLIDRRDQAVMMLE